MQEQITIGTIWENKRTGEKQEVTAITQDGRVQISPLNGDGYTVMKATSLRNNYTAVAKDRDHMEAQELPAPETETEPAVETVDTEPAPEPPSQPTEAENKVRKPAGRVKMPDGSIIAGSKFITDICGKTRADTYNVDSPIRWLLKSGQELLKSRNAEIVYGEKVTR